MVDFLAKDYDDLEYFLGNCYGQRHHEGVDVSFLCFQETFTTDRESKTKRGRASLGHGIWG